MKLNSIRLKICGMRAPANIREVARLHPDYMGFIFFKKSPRYVGPGFTIPDNIPADIQKVGVFVNEPVSSIRECVSRHSLDLVQLHGEESPANCQELQMAGIRVIKVFSVGGRFDFATLNPYKMAVNYFMFDTKGSDYGGTGTVFDWKLLERYDQEIPFFLSGGLSPENVYRVSALKGMNLHALDVNSGVEVSPGLKNVGLVKKLIKTLEQSLN